MYDHHNNHEENCYNDEGDNDNDSSQRDCFHGSLCLVCQNHHDNPFVPGIFFVMSVIMILKIVMMLMVDMIIIII